jgi:hypothetical protein
MGCCSRGLLLMKCQRISLFSAIFVCFASVLHPGSLEWSCSGGAATLLVRGLRRIRKSKAKGGPWGFTTKAIAGAK